MHSPFNKVMIPCFHYTIYHLSIILPFFTLTMYTFTIPQTRYCMHSPSHEFSISYTNLYMQQPVHTPTSQYTHHSYIHKLTIICTHNSFTRSYTHHSIHMHPIHMHSIYMHSKHLAVHVFISPNTNPFIHLPFHAFTIL